MIHWIVGLSLPYIDGFRHCLRIVERFGHHHRNCIRATVLRQTPPIDDKFIWSLLVRHRNNIEMHASFWAAAASVAASCPHPVGPLPVGNGPRIDIASPLTLHLDVIDISARKYFEDGPGAGFVVRGSLLLRAAVRRRSLFVLVVGEEAGAVGRVVGDPQPYELGVRAGHGMARAAAAHVCSIVLLASGERAREESPVRSWTFEFASVADP